MLWTSLFVLNVITSDGNRDFYQILGLKHDATQEEIHKAFKRLAYVNHPDKNPNNPAAAEKYEAVNDAKRALEDPNKRRVYDLFGEQGVHIYETHRSDIEGKAGYSRGTSEDDLVRQVKRVGKLTRLEFPVDLMDFFVGRVYKVPITHRVMCRCPESGFFCPKCRGRPTMRESANLTLIVEKGADDRTSVVFRNMGDVSEVNGPGDLEIVLVTKPDPFYRREQEDLHINVEVTLKEALLGFRRVFKHFDGSELVVESKTPLGCGRTLRIPGKGLPKYLFPDEFGDVVVHTSIKWPKSLPEEAIARLSSVLRDN